MRDATLQNVHAEFSLFLLFQGKHETIQTCLKKKRKKKLYTCETTDWYMLSMDQFPRWWWQLFQWAALKLGFEGAGKYV